LISATASDLRDVLIEGPSGVLATAPPWCVPTWHPSMRRLVWPNGAKAICISGEEPARARGPNVDTILADELAHWKYPRETWDAALLTLRRGSDPRAMICTTPKRVDVLVRILSEPTTAITRGSTFDNAAHLSPAFIDEITSLYKNTRLERQEIQGHLVDTPEGSWFGASFSEPRHVSVSAEYRPEQPIIIGVDAGTSRTTGGVFLQSRRVDKYRVAFTCFGEYLAVDTYSGQNAAAIVSTLGHVAPRCRVDQMWIDASSTARTSIGPAAFGEYQAAFGRMLASAPSWNVADGLDVISGLLDRGDLVVHPRCTHLIEALKSYMRARAGSQWLDIPAGNQSPHEDMIDALRYGVIGHWPEGRRPETHFARVHASKLI
jgi:hypothetical protein